MPRWPLAVGLRKLHGLRVAGVLGAVVAAEPQVDASQESDVLVRVAGMADDDELLVVGAAPAGPRVEQHLAALLRDGPGQLGVLALALVQPTGLRPPDEAEQQHLASGQLGQHVADLGPLPVQPLLGVAPEVGEVNTIPGLCGAQLPVQQGEVFRAMHQGGHPVALGPGPDLRCTVASLGAGQEPTFDRAVAPLHPLESAQQDLQPSSATADGRFYRYEPGALTSVNSMKAIRMGRMCWTTPNWCPLRANTPPPSGRQEPSER